MLGYKHFTDIVYKMLRLRTALLLGLFVAIADAATKHEVSHYSPRLVLVLLILAFWYIYGTCLNDLADEEIDKINLKGNSGRPLINKETSRRTLWWLTFGCALLSLVLACLISRSAVVLTLGALILSYVYSMPPVKISYRGIWAPLLLPLGYVLFPFMLTATANRAALNHPREILLAGLYISFIARIILKDFRDVIGDKKFGKRTFIVRHGARATCFVSAAAWIFGAVIISFRYIYHPVFIVSLFPFTVAILFILRWLASEGELGRQVQLVGLIGRLGNGAALLILTVAYFEIEPAKSLTYNTMLIGVSAFGLSAAYSLYEPLLRSQKKL